MVHLAQISKTQPTTQVPVPDDDNYCSSVYGSRFAVQEMPGVEMPEREMPREVAYRLIKDELSLDGNPMLK